MVPTSPARVADAAQQARALRAERDHRDRAKQLLCEAQEGELQERRANIREVEEFGRGDDTVGNPHRTQISQFELFELILLLKFDKQLPVERFEAAVSQSAVPPPS